MSGSGQSRFLLDTNVVLYFLGGRLVGGLPRGDYAISVITEIELLFYPSLSTPEEEQIRDLLAQVVVVGIEGTVKECAIALRKTYRLKLPDAIIAATAEFLSATLLTNDIGLINLVEVNAQTVQIF